MSAPSIGTSESSSVALYPCLSYRDANAAIRFLVAAFGFEEVAVYRDEAGGVQHAELAIGPCIIMLGSERPDLGWVSPLTANMRTMTISIYWPHSLEALHARATAAGATIVRPLQPTSYGSMEFSVRDPEGNEWHWGTYRPERPARA